MFLTLWITEHAINKISISTHIKFLKYWTLDFFLHTKPCRSEHSLQDIFFKESLFLFQTNHSDITTYSHRLSFATFVYCFSRKDVFCTKFRIIFVSIWNQFHTKLRIHSKLMIFFTQNFGWIRNLSQNFFMILHRSFLHIIFS